MTQYFSHGFSRVPATDCTKERTYELESENLSSRDSLVELLGTPPQEMKGSRAGTSDFRPWQSHPKQKKVNPKSQSNRLFETWRKKLQQIAKAVSFHLRLNRSSVSALKFRLSVAKTFRFDKSTLAMILFDSQAGREVGVTSQKTWEREKLGSRVWPSPKELGEGCTDSGKMSPPLSLPPRTELSISTSVIGQKERNRLRMLKKIEKAMKS